MKNFSKKFHIFFLALSLLLPLSTFAQTGNGINIAWADPVTVSDDGQGNYTTTFSLSITCMTNPSALSLIVFADSDQDFEPASLMLNAGAPPANGQINFISSASTASFDMVPGTYFVAVVVDSASYLGGVFNPYSDASDFQVYGIGQVATSISSGTIPGGGGGGTNPIPGGGTNPIPGGGTNPIPGGGTNPIPGGGTNPVTDPTSSTYGNIQGTIANPLGVNTDILTFFKKLFELLLKIAIPIIAFFIIFAGFKFVKSAGDPKGIEEAKQNLLYVIIGGAVILGCWVIVQVINGTVEQFVSMNLLINIVDFV